MLIYNSIGQARNTETERPCHSECVTGLQSRVSGGSINLWTKLPNPEVSKGKSKWFKIQKLDSDCGNVFSNFCFDEDSEFWPTDYGPTMTCCVCFDGGVRVIP